MSSFTTLTVSAEYGYVIATAAFSTFIGHWLALRVGSFRRAAKVPYPNCYATDAEAKADKAKYLFNCAQRAHANFLEHQSTFLASLLISGLSYPIVSAGLGVAWSVARVLYAIGYTNPDKQAGSGRRIGVFFWLPELALQFTAGFTGWKMIMVSPTQREDMFRCPKYAELYHRTLCLATMVIGATISYLEISQHPRRANRLANTYVDACFEVTTSATVVRD